MLDFDDDIYFLREMPTIQGKQIANILDNNQCLRNQIPIKSADIF